MLYSKRMRYRWYQPRHVWPHQRVNYLTCIQYIDLDGMYLHEFLRLWSKPSKHLPLETNSLGLCLTECWMIETLSLGWSISNLPLGCGF